MIFTDTGCRDLRHFNLKTGRICIAVTYGAQPVSHDALVAPFLGEHLQNHLIFVSPERDALLFRIIPVTFNSRIRTTKRGYHGLLNMQVTYVLSLKPPTTELKWMQEHPDTFIRLAGSNDEWGLFRIVY